jgi:murein DD-endopeptidase MepM/ murein hydrolase activator NlpD
MLNFLNRDVMNRTILIYCLLALALALAPVVAGAKNIYKYQDENGIWHFTDQAPEEDISFETVYMEREPEPRIKLRQEGSKQSPVYIVFNDFWGPAEVELRLSEAVNIISEPQLPARFVIPGQKERVLAGLGPADPMLSSRYKLHVASVPGPPTPQAVVDQVIHPPFPAGKAYPISQGFNGTRTHTDEGSRYAIDIVMPVDTLILAVRDGIVMDVEEDFNQGGKNKEKYQDKANHIRILHTDGTMALYAHLGLASVIVRPGARVRSGQPIARSGNTGFSSGPHLHFAIQQNLGMELISVPFLFRQANGNPAPPEENQLLQGLLPIR